LKKRILPLVLAIGLVLTFCIPATSQAAKSVAEIDRQLKDLEQQKAEAKKKAESAKQQIGQLKTEKAQTTKDIQAIMTQLDETSAKLSDLTQKAADVSAELKDNAAKLDEVQGRVDDRDKLLKSRLRLIYMNGFSSYMEVLLSATSFSDFIDRASTLKSLVGQDQAIMAANIKDRNIAAEQKSKVETQLAEVKSLYAEANDVRQTLAAQEKEKEVKVASISKKEQELESISEDQEKLLVQFASKESALLREKAASGTFTYTGGKFGYPLPKPYPQTSGFGVRINPITGKAGEFHKGLDFGAPQGTSILAAENGVVIVAGWWSGYGNTVIIDHGNNTWTLYGHIRNDGIVVQKGQAVKRGQKIAEVGSTGNSTGNHLHFEVRINEKPVDPTSYLRK
jgi:murein DD-endopeptidase MepM/ murein hydrolase activator NlpD